MNEATLGLARRAVASPHWRWLPGMRVVYAGSDEAFRVCAEPAWVDGLYHRHGIDEDWDAAPDGELPDLSDPATVGCLLALVREAWGCPVWVALDADPEPLDGHDTVVCGSERWTAYRVGWGLSAQPCGSGPTEAAALVAALEAAPTPEEK